jgi:hypothetical protein
MADYMKKYRRRVGRNGKNVGEAYDKNTISFTEATFHKSTTFRVAKVISYEQPNITEMDVRVVSVERLGSLKEILFRPLSKGLNVGTIVEFDEHKWLIFDTFSEKKATVAQCNRKLKWMDKSGKLQSFDCVASASDLGSKAKQSRNEIEFNQYDIKLPTGQLFVFVELRPETEAIKLNQRFVFGNKVYEVTGIDDTTSVREIGKQSYGILQLTVTVTTIKEEDDFDNKIAFNKYENDSTFTPKEGDSDIGKGGRIW